MKNIFFNEENKDSYFSINEQNKLKILTKLFTYIISKNIEILKFNVIDNILIYDNCNLNSRFYDLQIKSSFFNEFKIYNKDIIQFPLINIIKDLKSYKGKKIFPQIFFIFKKDFLIIKSLYENNIELTNVINNQYYNTSNIYKLESIIDSKQPDISFDLNIDKINILLNNSYIKEYSEFIIEENNIITIVFIDTHSNKKIIKSVIKTQSNNENLKFLVNNSVIKDFMKFFKDNIITFDIYINELKIIYTIHFQDNDIKLKLITNFEISK